MISVCMATYNGSKYIAVQMKSILEQLSENDEVIVQDDCSQDNTVQILQSMMDKRIKIDINESNQGVISTFEQSLKRASGDIIFLSDQDDEWLPGKVEITMNEFLNPTTMAVVTDAVIIDRNENVVVQSYHTAFGSRAGVAKNFIRNSYLGCCLAFRRQVLQCAIPIPKGVRTHDGWLGITANMLGGVKFVPVPLLKYRRHGNNASQMHRFPIKDVIMRRIILAAHIIRVQPKIFALRYSIKRQNSGRLIIK